MRLALVLLVVAGCLTPGAAAQEAAPGALTVAYAAEGSLWLWREGGEAQRLTEDVAAQALALSPGGVRVAFMRASDGAPRLWVVDADGQNARDLIVESALQSNAAYGGVDQFAWLSDDVLYYNTIVADEAGWSQPANDLWCADLSAGAITRLLAPGEGGRFALAPDGEYLALSTPGVYGDIDSPGRIDLVDLDGASRVNALAFPGVSTASEYAFYAIPHWLPDGSAFRVAVPVPDAVYTLTPPPPVALWEVPVAGVARQIGEAPADYFSVVFNDVFWSPDGAHIAYTQRVGALEENRVSPCIAGGDGSSPVCHDEGTIGAYAPLGWKPDGSAFIYRIDTADTTSMWMLTTDGAHQPIPGEIALALTWADAETYVYVTSVDGMLALKIARQGEAPQTLVVTDGWPLFSVLVWGAVAG